MRSLEKKGLRQAAVRIAVACALLVAVLVAGWFIASTIGREFLRHELEDLLSDLMAGEVRIGEIQLELASGIALRGFDVGVYPADDGPDLHGREVYVELNESALLVGEFRLAVLSIDGLSARLRIDRAGDWRFPPLRALQVGTDAFDTAHPDSVLVLLTAADAVSRVLMEDRAIADVVSVHGARVEFEDLEQRAAEPAPEDGDTPPPGPLRVSLENLDAELSRPWRSRLALLRLVATLVEPSGLEVPVRIRGRADADGRRALSLSVDTFDLDVFDRYMARLGRRADLGGHVSGTLSLESAAIEGGEDEVALEVELAIDGVVSTIPSGGAPIEVTLPFSKLDFRLEMEEDAVRIVRANATGRDTPIDVGMTAEIARPLSAESVAEISAELRGARTTDINPILEQLPDETVESLRLWFDSVQSGLFQRFGIHGSAPVSLWIELAGGELAALPDGFRLIFEMSEVTAKLDDGATIDDMSFRAVWSGKELEVSDVRGRWQGEPLPVVDVHILGLTRFLGRGDVPFVSGTPPPISGAAYLWELVSAAGSERVEDTDESDPRKLEIELDFLRHPLFGWPLERASIVVEPRIDGTHARLDRGFWGGVPIRGDLTYQEHPEERARLRLEADPDLETLEPERDPAPRPEDGESWARGDFVLKPVEYDPTPPDGVLGLVSGNFALRGSALEFEDVRVAVGPTATADIDLAVDLAHRGQIGVSLGAKVADVRLAGVSAALDLPEDFLTGTMELETKISGEIRRGEHPYDDIAGTIRVEAKDGEIKQRVPMIVALATATDGFNPFATKDALHFDTVLSELRVEHGNLVADRFELEGPIRVYAKGSLDFGDPPHAIKGVVGIFLFQRTRELLDKVPLVNLVVPGSDKGMVGAYFGLGGSWEDPTVVTLKMKSLKEQLPDIITKPFDFLGLIFGAQDENELPPAEAGAP